MQAKYILRKLRLLANGEAGSLSVMSAFIMTVFIGLMALAIDLGRLTLVMSELQRAVDAGALAGARNLLVSRTETGAIDWSRGKDTAIEVVKLNTADGKFLANYSDPVRTGYWDLTWTRASAPKDENGFVVPKSDTITPTANDVPAVAVGLIKTTGKNDGPVLFSLSAVLGVNHQEAKAQAVALLPGGPTGAITFPLAFADGFLPEIGGSPKTISFNPSPEDGVFWHNYKRQNVSTSDISKAVTDASKRDPISIGDTIRVNNGNHTSAISDMDGLASPFIIIVPVIPGGAQAEAGHGNSHGGSQNPSPQDARVLDFAALKVTGVNSHGNNKSVTVQRLGGVIAPGSTGSGTNARNGIYSQAPKLGF